MTEENIYSILLDTQEFKDFMRQRRRKGLIQIASFAAPLFIMKGIIPQEKLLTPIGFVVLTAMLVGLTIGLLNLVMAITKPHICSTGVVKAKEDEPRRIVYDVEVKDRVYHAERFYKNKELTEDSRVYFFSFGSEDNYIIPLKKAA